MELICESFYFYNNGVCKTIENYSPEGWFTDLKRVEPSIKIFGTREQIDKALDDYIELTGLNLDEVYDYEDKEMLKVYKKKYNKMNNNKALITTI